MPRLKNAGCFFLHVPLLLALRFSISVTQRHVVAYDDADDDAEEEEDTGEAADDEKKEDECDG
jgi:hypothetical protein